MTSSNRPDSVEGNRKLAQPRTMPRTRAITAILAVFILLGAGLIYATSQANVTAAVHLDCSSSTTEVFPAQSDGKTFCGILADKLANLGKWKVTTTRNSPASGRGLKITAFANSIYVATVKMSWGHYKNGKFIVEKTETTGIQSYDASLSAGSADPVARQVIRTFGQP